jgi:hypothetical protein
MKKVKTPADTVIDVLGVRPLARSLEIAPSTISRWREGGGNVPSKYHIRIIDLAKGDISTDDLVYGR